MKVKPTYEELERRVLELEKIESEYKYSKEALRESESLFKRLYEKAPLGYQSLDENGHFIVVNQTWLDTLGYSREEVIGKSFAEFLHPDWRDHFKENFPRFKSIGEILGVEFEMVKKNGNLILVSFTGKISIDEKGNFQQTHCIFHDITERMQAEEQLQRSEEQFRNLYDEAPVGYFEYDLQGNITRVNHTHLKMLGYIAEEMISQPCWKFIVDEVAREQIMAKLDGVRPPAVGLERTYRRKDGTTFPVLSEDRLLLDEDGDIKGIRTAIQDITDRKHMEEALKDNEAWLGEIMRITCVGGWKFDPLSNTLEWTDETFRIHELPIGDPPNVAEAILFFHVDDRPRISALLQHAVEKGEGFDFEARIITAKQNLIWIRSIGHVSFHEGHKVIVWGTIQDITERKRAENALRKSESFLSSTVDGLTAHITVLDDQGEIILTNKAYRDFGEQNGVEPRIVSEGNNYLAVCDSASGEHSEEAAPFAEGIRDVLSGKCRSFELEYPCHSLSEERWFVARVTSFVDEGARRVIIAHENITERKRAEATLRESEERIRTIGDNLEGAQLYQIRVAPDGDARFTYVSNKVEELHECKPEDILKDASLLFKRVHPADVAEWQKLTNKSLRELTTYNHTVRIVRKSGEIRWHRMISKPHKLDDGSVLFDGVELDVTELKRAEDAVRKSEEVLRDIVESTLAGFWDWNLVDNTEYLSPTFKRMFGYGDHEMENSPEAWQKIIFPEDLPGVLEVFDRHVKSRGLEPFYNEVRYRHRDGSTVWVTCAGRVVEWAEDGSPVRMVGCHQDITKRKQAEAEREKLQAQLNQAHKLESVGRLAGGIAHDFNNMLGVILGHTEMALEETDPASPLYADLHSVHQAGERSAALTRQLLAFARKQTIAPRVIDINDTVEGMLKMLRRLIGEDIDLLWQPGRNLQPVKIDPSQIDQLLANLCVNARDAIDGVGKITIETDAKSFDEDYCHDHLESQPGDYVLLEVSDDGCGMDKKTLSHIFEPFFTTKEQGQGTGLGLASIYGIVKQNNGFINVYSEPDQGTTFKIYLPAYTAKSDEVVEKALDQPTEHGNETILLVEDETAILEMTTRMLERLGYKVVAAATPGEAIRLAHEYEGRVDLLMTDVVMPEMNGRELARNLLSHYPNLKRLFMSGYTANVIAHHGVLDQGVHFIQKPFSKKDLGRKVREALEV